MSFQQRQPMADVVAKTRVITSAALDQMITRVPWQPGSQKYYDLRKITITTAGAAQTSGTVSTTVALWDKDLSSTTPATRGNASTGALLTIAVPPGTGNSGNFNTFTLGLNETPRIRFEAGVAVQSTGLNTAIMLELEMH